MSHPQCTFFNLGRRTVLKILPKIRAIPIICKEEGIKLNRMTSNKMATRGSIKTSTDTKKVGKARTLSKNK